MPAKSHSPGVLFFVEAGHLPWQADASQDLALTRNRPCYAIGCVDKKLGVIFDVDTSIVRAT